MRNSPSFNDNDQENQKYEHWLDFLARQYDMQIQIDPSLQTSMAIDLQNMDNPTVIINPKRIKDEFQYTDDEIVLDLAHELWHFKEQREMLHHSDGTKQEQQRQKRLEEKWPLATSYHELENVLRDIYVNNNAILPENLPVLKNTLYTNYRDKMFPWTDYLQNPVYNEKKEIIAHQPLPKHLQFLYTLIRESMVPDQPCTIDPEVRKLIQRLKRNGVLTKSTTGELYTRLQNMREYVEPMYGKLLEEDKKNEQKSKKNESKNQKSDQQQGQSDSSQSSQSSQESSDTNQPKQWPKQNPSWQKKPSKNIKERIKDILQWNKQDQDPQEWNNQESSPSSNTTPAPSKDENNQPKNPFDEYYQNMPKPHNLLEELLSPEDKKKLEEALQTIYDEKHSPKDRETLELENRVKNMWIQPSQKDIFQDAVKQLRAYDKFLQQLENVKDPKTGETIIEEIEHIFEKIKSHRLKPRYRTKWPVDIEHGYRLYAWALGTGLAEIQSGNLNPEMFELDIKHENPDNFIGKFDVTIVADGSGSMSQNNKNRYQKISVLLILEWLKRLHDKLERENKDLKQGVEFTTEGTMFCGSWSVAQFKAPGNDFLDAERLQAYKTLNYQNGNTNDFDALHQIMENIQKASQEYQEDIKAGKTKKIVIVLSDWWSDSDQTMKNEIKILRERGVLVYGIGITDSWSPIINLFASRNKEQWFGQVCKKPEDLAQVIKELLFAHIEKL